MRRCRIVTAIAAGLMVGLLWARTATSDDGQPPPRERPKGAPAADNSGGPPPRDGDVERGRRPPPKPGEGDFDRHGPREGDFRGGPRHPSRPGEGDFDRPPSQPGEGDFRPGHRGPMAREGRAEGPPPEGGPGRPGPWPHENLQWLERSDPEMAKLLKEDMDLDRQTRELAMQYRRAPADQRDALKKQVADAVAKHFEARQKRRQLELKRLESEIQGVRESIERREKARSEIIERRVSEILGREDDMRF